MKKKLILFLVVGVVFVFAITKQRNLDNHLDIHGIVYLNGEQSYELTIEKTNELLDIFTKLNYDPNRLCDCLSEYTIDIRGDKYGINLSEGYVRCDRGQADLSADQITLVKQNMTDYPKYSFALTWGTYGISSYDSQSGTLIKTSHATYPNDYITNCKLTDEQYSYVWKLIEELDIESYPDEYHPHSGYSEPDMTLILSVKTEDIDKTITASEIALSYKSDNEKGQRFLDVCKEISEMLMNTNEWKSLPEYEFLYS